MPDFDVSGGAPSAATVFSSQSLDYTLKQHGSYIIELFGNMAFRKVQLRWFVSSVENGCLQSPATEALVLKRAFSLPAAL